MMGSRKGRPRFTQQGGVSLRPLRSPLRQQTKRLRSALDFLGAQWGAGYSVRPLVRIAYASDNWSTGIELSYRFGYLDFGDGDGNIDNFNAGVFVSFKL